MNSVLQKIVLILPEVLGITTNTLKDYTTKYEGFNVGIKKLTTEDIEICKTFSSFNPNHLYAFPNFEYTIDGVTSWNTFGLFKKKIYKVGNTKAQREAMEIELNDMEVEISDLFSGIALELSDYYKNNGLPEKIAIEIDIATRETTISEHFGERVVEHKFVLPPFKPETTTEPKNSKNQS